MFFWWICGEERVLPVLFLHHLSLPSLNYYLALARCEWQDKRGWVGSSFSLLVYLLLLVFTTIFTFQGKWCGTRSEMQIHVCTWTFWRIEFVSDVWFFTFCNELTCNWVPITSGMTKFYSVLPFSLKWDVHLNMYNIIYETSRQSRFNARYWMLEVGALGQPRGMVQGRGREEGGGFRMGNTCIPMVDSCWYMAKPI